MKAFFHLPVASSLADKSSSVSDGAGSVGVSDGDRGVGAFFLGFLALGGLGGSWSWEPVVSSNARPTAAVKASAGLQDSGLWIPTGCLLDGAVFSNLSGLAVICMALSMSGSGSPLSEECWSHPVPMVPPGMTALPFFLAFFWSAWWSSSFFWGCFVGIMVVCTEDEQ